MSKLRVALVITLAVLMLFCLSGQALAESPKVKVLISFNLPTTLADNEQLQKAGGIIRYRFRHIPVISVEIPEQALRGLRKNPRVAIIEEDGVAYAIEQTLPWGVDHIDAEVVHAYNKKGAGIKVAIVDTGIDLDHPDLQVAGDVSFVSGAPSGEDDHGHGTHVAGTVAALDNDFGVIGVAPEAELYAVKVLDGSGRGYWSDIIAGIEWSIDHSAQIINMSLGGTSGSSTLEMACDAAFEAGVLIVAAAGNSGNSWALFDNVLYPARYDSVIAVAATDSSDDRVYFSSTGPDVELAAPGINILSTAAGGGYTTKMGTSMASPHVAGVGALMFASGINDANGNGRINDEVRERLQLTARDLGIAGRDNLYGYGLVDAAGAVPQENSPPTAPEVNITPELPVTTDDLVCELTAPGTDPDGDTITYSYAWYKDDALQLGLTADTVASANTTKDQVWKCVVTPNDGIDNGPVGEDEVTIQNSPPVANAGPDQTVIMDTLVTLDGSGSLDDDGDVLTYAWAQTGGPSVTLSDPASVEPTFTPAEVETYTFSLVVNDGNVDSLFDSVVISVMPENTPPELSTGNLTPVSGFASTSFLYSVNYTDADNDPPTSVTVTIDGGVPQDMTVQSGQDGDFSNGEIYEHSVLGTDLGVGDHTFQFAAEDNFNDATGDTGMHSGPIIVNSPPTAPEVNITPELPFTIDDLVCEITVPGTDPDGDTITYSYAWYKDDALQLSLTTDTVASANTTKGQVWKCVVTPNDGVDNGPAGEDEVTIQNSPPVVDAGPDQSVLVDTLVTLDGSGSLDDDGDVLACAWAQTGGPSVTLSDPASVEPTFTPAEVETYTFSLVVNDGTVDSAPDEVIIYVTSAVPMMHVDTIDMLLVQKYGGWRTYAEATVTILDADGNPVENVIVDGHWEGATTDSDTGITGVDGKVTLTSNYRRRPASGTTYTFIIDNIAAEGWLWDEISSVVSASIVVP